MKRFYSVLFMCFVISLSANCYADQQCNPNYNSVITGVPYCKGIGTQSLTTKNPNKINNAWKPDNNSTTINNPMIYYSPFIPPYGNNGINTLQSAPSTLQQNYFDNTSPQVVPNTPSDSLPLEIPGNNSDNYY